ncbi:hypothetical protein CVS40_4846 [Lucilia cuprina]|nr:hypothetical protein CVS40_4846 [Lucilia cuprina]
MMNKNKIIVCHYISLLHAVLENERKSKKQKKRIVWVRDIFKKREELGFGSNLIKEMLLNDHETFFNFSRMTKSQFKDLLFLVGPSLSKNSLRKPICEKNRLLITLRYLATGMSYSSLSFEFRVAKSTIHYIITETTDAIWNSLNDKYIPKPTKQNIKKWPNYFG